MKKYLIKCGAIALLLAFLVPMGNGLGFKLETSVNAVEASSGEEDLPRVNLYTDSKQPITKKEYEGATMSIGLTDRFADYSNLYTTEKGGDIEIRCRGNSTYETHPNRLGDSGKYSYKIKLDTKVNMLGMGKSKHWVLIANYYDVTNMRNKLVYDLAGAMGLTYTQSRWIVVYLNGEYQGLYTLCESIRIEGDRVDITDWEDRAELVAKTIARMEGLSETQAKTLEDQMESDLSWVTSGTFKNYKISDYVDMSDMDVDSGYLLEYDMRQDGDTSKFTTGRGVKIQLDSPEALNTNPEMFNFVKGRIDDMEEAFYSETFCTNEGVHYSEFVDMQSLVDYFIIFHLFKNIEFGWLSIFLYIEDGTIYFGPCWDFDGSAGNQVTLYEDWMNPERWFYMNGRAEWWKELCGDPYFVAMVEERWQEIRPLLDVYMESLPVWNEYIDAEAAANFDHFGAPKNWYIGGACKSYASEYSTLVTWMNRRIAWLDTQWSMRDPNIEGRGLQSSEKITMTLTYANGAPLSPDTLTVKGARSDLLYDLSKKDGLKLTVSTLHTTHRNMLIYVNGKLLCKNVLDMNTPATVTVPRTVLNTEPGAVNVIYMVGINHENNYYRAGYLSLRMAEDIPSEGQCVLRVGNAYLVADKGDKVKLPEIDVHADGFDALGWTDGNGKLYKSGETVTVNQSGYYWIDWKRTDALTEFVLEEGAAEDKEPQDPPTPPPATTTTTTTAKPTTTTTKPVTTTTTTTTTKNQESEMPPVTTTAKTQVTEHKPDMPGSQTATGGIDKPEDTTVPKTDVETSEPTEPSVTPSTTASTVPSASPDGKDDNDGTDTDDDGFSVWIALVAIPVAIGALILVILLLKKKKSSATE